MENPVCAYVGLGSNLQSPQQQLEQALDALARIPGTRLLQASSLYRSAPMGPQDQPDYLNAVAALETTLTPHELLDQLQSIETAQGRVRGATRWGARTLDLDLLLYGNETINNERLVVPHPGMKERSFVLYPLYEIAPGLLLPSGETLASLLDNCPREGLKVLP
ncbi:MAG: 2-amino-4-hydroxy-6-hydroxymethyldihydropteridine diphosphokinase [Gammaproteobacteria bacterium]|nr:2-amino-4-hydroxy-6-hydroxymethyldihydropteridine diphosphokinase [Gammaproteobacteria bacterium]